MEKKKTQEASYECTAGPAEASAMCAPRAASLLTGLGVCVCLREFPSPFSLPILLSFFLHAVAFL